MNDIYDPAVMRSDDALRPEVEALLENKPAKDTIIALVGPSGAGKSTVAKMLEEQGYNVIKSYTSRLPRGPDEWGHRFVMQPWRKLEEGGVTWVNLWEGVADWRQAIAYTVYNGAAYFALPEDYRGKGISIYIVDPSGVESLRREVRDAKVVAVYLQAGEMERQRRLWTRRYRPRKGDFPAFCKFHDEAWERVRLDRDIFRAVSCDYVVNANGSPEDTLELVKKVIEVVTA